MKQAKRPLTPCKTFIQDYELTGHSCWIQTASAQIFICHLQHVETKEHKTVIQVWPAGADVAATEPGAEVTQ
jgi:hypothetical protein